MARKAPHPAAAPVEPEPPPETAPADQVVTHRDAAKLMLQAVAGLPLDRAQDRLRHAALPLPPGLTRRALLRARIALWRGQAAPAPPVETLPDPEPAAADPAAARPLRAGALSTMALEDAARMLFAADPEAEGEGDEAEADSDADPTTPGEDAPDHGLADVANLFAMMDAPEPEAEAEAPSGAFADPAEEADPAGLASPTEARSISGVQTAKPDGIFFHPIPPSTAAVQVAPGELDLSLTFAALDEGDEDEPVEAEGQKGDGAEDPA